MKKICIKILFIISYHLLFAQNEITLETCFKALQNHYPIKKQIDNNNQIFYLRHKISNTNWYPSLMLKGQASYQSDVNEINFTAIKILMKKVYRDILRN